MAKRWAYIALIFSFGCSEQPKLLIASTELYSYDTGSGIELMGTFRASLNDELVTINISLINQTPGTIRAIHLYEGTCENPGEIWNMNSEQNYCNENSNGVRWSKPRIGDVGNIVVNNDGTADFEMSTNLWALKSGELNDISDKLVIIHAGPADFLEECDPNHVPDHFHPNSMIACGMLN